MEAPIKAQPPRLGSAQPSAIARSRQQIENPRCRWRSQVPAGEVGWHLAAIADVCERDDRDQGATARLKRRGAALAT